MKLVLMENLKRHANSSYIPLLTLCVNNALIHNEGGDGKATAGESNIFLEIIEERHCIVPLQSVGWVRECRLEEAKRSKILKRSICPWFFAGKTTGQLI